ncbi:MAG: PAS domain-containing protein, partial [Candidatus Methanoperedens sp.]
AERLLGLSREEQHQRKIDGKEWTIVLPDGTPLPAQEYASVRALRENRIVENMEMGIVKAGGEITWINVTAAPLPLEKRGVVITYNDITPRKQAEAELLLLNQTLKAAQNMAKVGYWIYDIKTRMPIWSEQMFVVFGVDPKNGVPHYDEHRKIWHPDDWELFNNSVQECEKGKPYNIVVRVIFPDKSTHYINTQGFPRYNEKGEIYELFGTSQDITEHKIAEEELLKHREHLEELVKERTAQVNQKNEELEKFNKFFVGRELKMIELKKKVAELEKKVKDLEKPLESQDKGSGTQ